MQRYLQVLAEVVERQKELASAPSMAEVQAEVRAALPQEPVVKVAQRKYMSISEYVHDRVGLFNREQVVIALIHTLWETLERYRKLEEQYSDRDLPTQPLAAARAQITSKIIAACAELRKQELSDLERRKIEADLGLGDFESETLSGDEVPEPYASMSETDRMFARSWMEKGLAAQRLQKQIAELQSQSATGEPPAK